MGDDLGRGMLGWDTARWQALDALASDTVTGNVVMRNLVDHKDDAGAFSARIAGKNVDVATLKSTAFVFDMEHELDEDLDRKVRLGAQDLARKEDDAVLGAMNPAVLASALDYAAFSQAKKALADNGVQQGFGAALSTKFLTNLEIQALGVKSGLEVAEGILSTKLAQTNSLPKDGVEAIVVQATPPAYRMVRAWEPRLRVLAVGDGKKVKIEIEEGIAVGELEPKRCVGIRENGAVAAGKR